jgi:signal transduction histidine kinase
LALPVRVGNRLIGVLDLQSNRANRFSDDDVRAITPLAEQVGIGVESARLYARQGELIEELRNADQMKSQFLASMSHELRTPLNSILTFSDLMSMGTFGDVNDEQVDYLQKILFSGRHLLALINDVLDISKMESGMMKLFVEDDFEVVKEVDVARATIEKMIGEKPVKLIVDVDTPLPQLTVDKRRVRQVLLNILSNAVKFTEEGTITLSAKLKGDDILFAVMDTGPGIAEDQHEQIFEPFVQTETGIKHAGGTGLGLPISKRLAEAHGGRMWLESTLGEGTAFFFTLPLVPIVQAGEVAMKSH